VNVIACPTCGRCAIDLPPLVQEIEERLCNIKENLTVALMGCVVNGIGEAGEADIGIAGGRGAGVLFKKGKALAKVAEADFVMVLMEHLTTMLEEQRMHKESIQEGRGRV
jgi:(E)-4-hydroxy-3-methylbut-2-enyl-diphosphate synthase